MTRERLSMADREFNGEPINDAIAGLQHGTPYVAIHSEPADDGSVTVTYTSDKKTWTETYPSRREASITSMLRMFPGTSREWLERMHTS